MYRGSKGKVADFQCDPAKCQMMLDAVNAYANAEGLVLDIVLDTASAAGDNMGESRNIE